MFINLQLFAHHKGGGSTKNGRDSIAKRLGVKKYDGEINMKFNEDDMTFTSNIVFEIRR